MKDEYISVSEFARRAGVSRQAIQQRLNTSLRGYVKIEQGKKLLNIKGLELFKGASLAQGYDKQNDNLAQGIIDTLQRTIDALQGQLDVKDQQLQAKDLQLQEKDKQLASLTATLEHTTQALQAAQALHAGTMQQQLGPGVDQSQEPEPVITVEEPAQEPETAAAPEEPEPVNKGKLSFWQRIRRKS